MQPKEPPAYTYQFLSEDEQDEIIVEKLLAQERDLFSRDVNIANSQHILANLPANRLSDAKTLAARGDTLPMEHKFALNIEKFLSDETSRRDEVQRITDAVKMHLPTPARATSALARVKAREAQARAARG